MNKKNIRSLIALMKKVEKYGDGHFDIGTFSNVGHVVKAKFSEAVKCNTVCCVSGWLPYHKPFRDQGVIVGSVGHGLLPEVEGQPSDEVLTMSKLLGVSFETAEDMIYPGAEVYGVLDEEVKPHHVIAKLQDLLLNGE